MFSKEIIKILNLDPRQIYIKCNSGQWPCIINSSSLMLAKIIIGTKGGAYAAIQKTNTPVSLRFFFSDANGQTMSFFVNAHVTAIDPYMNSTELAIATLTFNSKPPDDLIEMVGRLLETKANALKRREERIPITAESKRRLSLVREETIIKIQNVPRNCIVRDLSFSGAKLIMMGVAQFLQNKEAVLQLEFDEPRETISLKGKTVHVAHIEGRKELVTVSLKFDEEAVPISYKVHINNCLTAVRQKMLNSVNKQAEQPVAQAAGQKAATQAAPAQPVPAGQTAAQPQVTKQ